MPAPGPPPAAPAPAALGACLAIAVAYVASLYAWGRPHALGRQAPGVVARRIASVAAVSGAAWLPAAAFAAAAAAQVRHGGREQGLGPAARPCGPRHAARRGGGVHGGGGGVRCGAARAAADPFPAPPASRQGAGPPAAPTAAQLLGLRAPGLARAAALPLLPLATLFAGPLLHLAADAAARRDHPLAYTLAAAFPPRAAPAGAAAAGSSSRDGGRDGGGGGGAGGARAARLQLLRDLAVAPAAEEWVFRACMVPLLWLAVRGRAVRGRAGALPGWRPARRGGAAAGAHPHGRGQPAPAPATPIPCAPPRPRAHASTHPPLPHQGFSRRAIIFGTPLFFGAAHLHHLLELMATHRLPLHSALAMVRAVEPFPC
jgi:hypothetical protein